MWQVSFCGFFSKVTLSGVKNEGFHPRVLVILNGRFSPESSHQTLVSTIFRSIGTICGGFVSENLFLRGTIFCHPSHFGTLKKAVFFLERERNIESPTNHHIGAHNICALSAVAIFSLIVSWQQQPTKTNKTKQTNKQN